MVRTRFVVLVIMLFLAGCSSVTTFSPELSRSEKERLWQQHRDRLEKIESWSLAGRLGLVVPDHSGSMSIEWKQEGQQYLIDLDGPFGQSLVQIKGDRTGVTARVSDEKELVGPTPEYLMLKLTGWDLPVSSLRYWVKGLPAPQGEAKVTLNHLGFPQTIEQQGWQIDYLKYREESLMQMPVKLKAIHGQVRITLVVRSWQLQ